MDQIEIIKSLKGLPLSDIRYFTSVDSTNLEASRWADQGANDLSLVVADTQSAGKGRHGRKWFSPPGAALAFSLLLRNAKARISADGKHDSSQILLRYTSLGAVSVCDALWSNYHLQAEIKWPNDVLLDGRKIAGVLAEAQWQGEELVSMILGIGINVRPASVLPDEDLAYPATCVENALGKPINRTGMLRAVLERLLFWLNRIDQPEFIRKWNRHLAFKGEWVNIINLADSSGSASRQEMVIGLDPFGHLKTANPSGEISTLMNGELSLRPIKTAYQPFRFHGNTTREPGKQG